QTLYKFLQISPDFVEVRQDKKLLFIKSVGGLTGVYCWRNLENEKIYVGSIVDLKNWFSIYLSEVSLNRNLEKGTSLIYSSLLKYGELR
uniref:homing endonuclease n=1 Tax=Leptographium terebrantis TaxID=96390 RepID=UPI0023F29798